jgi:hypothetical protein
LIIERAVIPAYEAPGSSVSGTAARDRDGCGNRRPVS